MDAQSKHARCQTDTTKKARRMATYLAEGEEAAVVHIDIGLVHLVGHEHQILGGAELCVWSEVGS